MSVRLRRLAADSHNIGRAFAEHPHVRIVEIEGDPPERYKVEYRLKGLVVQDGKVVPKVTHLAEIYLPLGYPRQAPQCRMLSPIYHPNIAPHAICIGDHWSAGESLATLIARIGELITFQSYNVKSPLNGEAARWAEENVDRLPLQKADLSVSVEAAAPAPAAPPRPAVRFPSGLVREEPETPFPYDAWLKAVQAELQGLPEGTTLSMPISAVVLYLGERRLADAVREFDPIRTTPAAGRFPQVHFLVALIREAQQKPDAERQSLENAVKVDPTYALAWVRLALASLPSNAVRARECLEKTLALDPDHAEARSLLERLPAAPA